VIQFFITGMFRSGTTTIARALNAHPAMAVAADPFAELFKALRSEEAQALGQRIPVMAPLDDYYFDPDGQALLNRLRNKTALDSPFKVWDRRSLMQRLKTRCETYSGTLVPLLDNMEGDTYRTILDSMLALVLEAYGGPRTEVVGFKEVWMTEFIPILARAWKDARFLVVERDPRAVCASKNARDERYPWVFLSRQWRKLAALDYAFRNDPSLRDRVLSIRYEDFITHPEEITKKICDFVGVPWHPDIADPGCYRDGRGEPWFQNTAFGQGKADFDTATINRWSSVLSDREIRLIELMCGPEMGLYGYECINNPPRLDSEMIIDSPRIGDDEQARWMHGKVPNDPVKTAIQMAEEGIRAALLKVNSQHIQSVPEELIRAAFLDRRVFEEVSNQL